MSEILKQYKNFRKSDGNYYHHCLSGLQEVKKGKLVTSTQTPWKNILTTRKDLK